MRNVNISLLTENFQGEASPYAPEWQEAPLWSILRDLEMLSGCQSLGAQASQI